MNEDILKILFYNSLWVILLLYLRKTTKILSPSKVIVGMYLFFSLISLALYIFFVDCDQALVLTDLSTLPFLYLFVSVTIMIMPIIKYDRCKINSIQCPSDKLIRYFTFLFIICTLVMIPDTFASLQEGIVRIILNAEDGADLYQEFHENEGSVSGKASLIVRTCSFISNYCFEIFVFIFFYGIAKGLYQKKLLIIVSLIFIIQLLIPISQGLRTIFLMKFVPILFSVVLFYPYYNDDFKSFFRKVTFYFLISVNVPFILLSVGRSLAGSGNALKGPVEYAGQAPLVFNNYCYDILGTREGNRTCHEFKKILGFENVPDSYTIRSRYSFLGIDDGHFYTFVGDFVLDFGLWIAFAIFIIISVLVYSLTKSKYKYIMFHQLLILYFLMCVIAEGAMYLFTYSYKNNWVIIVVAVAAIIFRIDSKKNNRIVISKNIKSV